MSDGPNCVSDEVLNRSYKIKDLQKRGEVSVEGVIGRKGTKWMFQTMQVTSTSIMLQVMCTQR